jgi:CO dehydrogenase/acetyl-CoA synthase gamma subunit (corrinoid Fe-S protein)
MAVYKLLPGTNCKECGQPGCWQFALKLVTGVVTTGECPPLAQPEFASQLAELRGLIAEMA